MDLSLPLESTPQIGFEITPDEHADKISRQCYIDYGNKDQHGSFSDSNNGNGNNENKADELPSKRSKK